MQFMGYGRIPVFTGTAAQLAAMISMIAGDIFYTTDTKLNYVYNGSAWVLLVPSTTTYGLDILEQGINILRAGNSLSLNSYGYIAYDVFNTAAGILSTINTGSTTATWETSSKIYHNKGTLTAPNTTEINPNTPTATDSQTTKEGLKLTSTADELIVSVTKSAACNATTAYICDSSMSVLTTATFSGNTATFSTPYLISSGITFYIVVDSGGGSYTRTTAVAINLPYALSKNSLISYRTNNTDLTNQSTSITSFDVNVNSLPFHAFQDKYILTNAKTLSSSTPQSHQLIVHDTISGTASIKYDVSLDGGSTWDSTNNLLNVLNPFIGTGNSLVLKIKLNAGASFNEASCFDFGALINF